MIFKGIMPALITPFDEDEHVLTQSVSQLVDWHLESGVAGFYICGRTGEGPALRTSTRKAMAEAAMDAVRGRGVVINHIGAPNFSDTLDLVRHSQEIGVDAISSLAPTYTLNYSDQEIIDYYKRIAENTDLPVLIYATPSLVSPNFLYLIQQLLDVPNIVGVKFTRPNYFELQRLKTLNAGNINVLNGPDETLLCGLAMGADGGIGSSYNVMPEWFVALYQAFLQGDIETARKHQYKINQVIEILIKYGKNGALKAVKAVLAMKGYDVGYAAYPADHIVAGEAAALKEELRAVG